MVARSVRPSVRDQYSISEDTLVFRDAFVDRSVCLYVIGCSLQLAGQSLHGTSYLMTLWRSSLGIRQEVL